MTWVIGSGTVLGYGVAVSDIRVTFGDGSSKDCLQKVYPIARHCLAGFSGSVAIGFRLINDLQRYCSQHNTQRYLGGILPEGVMTDWRGRAQRLFFSYSETERRCGAAILLVAAHPTRDIGIPGMAQTMTVKMVSPSFWPIVSYTEPVSIGSGSYIDAYEAKLSEFRDISNIELENVMPFGFGSILGQTMGRAVEDNPSDGVSPHVHIWTIRRDGFTKKSNDYRQILREGEEIEFVMPPVAENHREFIDMCNAQQLNAEGSIG